MDFRVVAEGLQFPEGPIAMADGSIILVEIARKTLSRVTPDGKVEVIAETGGGPNGAALGPDGAVYICNNGGLAFHKDEMGLRPTGQPDDYSGGRIERIDLQTGEVTKLYDRCGDHPLMGPNDIVFDREGGMWFTDLGKGRARDLDRSGLYYAQPDGSSIVEAAYPILTANGVGLSPDEKTVYVAETQTGRLWGFDLAAPGQIEKQPWPSPHGGRLIGQTQGFRNFDSLAVDADGNILVATLMDGGITCIPSAGGAVEHIPFPDAFTTNICFGGQGLKTAYICLSQSGRLVAVDWPTAGLPLNFLNR